MLNALVGPPVLIHPCAVPHRSERSRRCRSGRDAAPELRLPPGIHRRGLRRRGGLVPAGSTSKLVPVDVRLHPTVDPEVVIAGEYDYEETATTTGRSFVVSNVQIVHVRHGRIVASHDFRDHAVGWPRPYAPGKFVDDDGPCPGTAQPRTSSVGQSVGTAPSSGVRAAPRGSRSAVSGGN